MTIGNAIVQGIVQGLTEFLPVSSSGHLSLVQYFTGQSGESGAMFTVLLHLGTLTAVVIAFRKTIGELIREFAAMVSELMQGKLTLRKLAGRRRMILLLLVSMVPMLLTVLLKDWFEALSSNVSILEEGLCFLLTSALLFLSGHSREGSKTAKSMSWADALVVGGTQAIAPLPGLSRSGSTIAVGLLLGLDRKYAVAFSFIMGIPAVLGASVLEVGDAVKEGLSIPVPALLAGLLFSLVFGLLAIRLVKWLVVSDKFRYFAWYTLVLGLVTIAAAVLDMISDYTLRSMIMGLFS